MSISNDSLIMFVEAATQGSFSAAARKLGKRQSTISEAIANLEITLDVLLFDRAHRLPHLTPAGEILLNDAQKILHANESLLRKASQLSKRTQLAITLVISDLYPAEGFRRLLNEINQQAPDIKLESLIAEEDDIITSIQCGRADIGLLAALPIYPPDIMNMTLKEHSEMVLVSSSTHPLSRLTSVTLEDLKQYRELKIEPFEYIVQDTTTLAINPNHESKQSWSTSHYMVLLEMVIQGYGWAEVPRWLINNYKQEQIHCLSVSGWPKQIVMDVIWSSRHKIEPITAWVLSLFQKKHP